MSSPNVEAPKHLRQPRLPRNAEEALWMGVLGLVALAILGVMDSFLVTHV